MSSVPIGVFIRRARPRAPLLHNVLSVYRKKARLSAHGGEFGARTPTLPSVPKASSQRCLLPIPQQCSAPLVQDVCEGKGGRVSAGVQAESNRAQGWGLCRLWNDASPRRDGIPSRGGRAQGLSNLSRGPETDVCASYPGTGEVRLSLPKLPRDPTCKSVEVASRPPGA